MAKLYFFKHHPNDKVWWVREDNGIMDDDFRFSFDKKKIYTLMKDYPDKLTKEEKAIFDAENEYWVNKFKQLKK